LMIIPLNLTLQGSTLALSRARESEKQFRLLAENSTDMISRHDPQGNYLYVSPACRTVLGYESEELIGRSAFEFIHPQDIAAVERALSAIVEQPINSTTVFRARRKTGDYIWLETISRSFFDFKTGELAEILAASRDVTERKAAENALKESEELLRGIFVSTPDSITVMDLEGRTILCSPSSASLHGYSSAEELVGKKLLELIAKEDHQRATEGMRQILSDGLMRDVPFVGLKKGGDTFDGELSVSIIKDSSGKPRGFVGITKDVTLRMRAEKELKKQMDELLSWQRVTIGRENRVIELKQEVNELLALLGKDPRYRAQGPGLGA
jgi:two-component system, NtrC family, sensor kinase